jgi:hypothetical protein
VIPIIWGHAATHNRPLRNQMRRRAEDILASNTIQPLSHGPGEVAARNVGRDWALTFVDAKLAFEKKGRLHAEQRSRRQSRRSDIGRYCRYNLSIRILHMGTHQRRSRRKQSWTERHTGINYGSASSWWPFRNDNRNSALTLAAAR